MHMLFAPGNLSACTRYSRRDLIIIGVLAVFPFLYYYKVVFLQTHTLTGLWDATVQSFAWYAQLSNALAEGTFPFWDMHTEAGEYFIGEMQTGAFYPPNWLFALFFEPAELVRSQYLADLYQLVHALFCSIFAYLFLRQLGIRQVPAVMGALVATYFGAIGERITAQPNIYFGMTWLPAVMFFTLKAWQSTERHRLFLFAGAGGLALAMCILSGHMYSYIHSALMAFLLLFFSCVTTPAYWKKCALILAIMAVSSVLVAYPQLDSTLEYFKRAYKWYGEGYTAYPHVVSFEEFSRRAFNAWHTLLTWQCGVECEENRTIFVGWAVWPLVIAGILFSPLARKVFLPAAIVVLLVSLAGDNLIGRLLYHIPVINTVRIPARILFVLPLLIAAMAAIGLDWLMENAGSKNKRAALLLCTAALFCVDLMHLQRNWLVTGIEKANLPYNPADYYADPAGKWLEEQLGQDSLYRWSAEPKEILPPNLGMVNGTNSLRGHRSSMLESYFYNQVSATDSSGTGRLLGYRYLVSATDFPELSEVFSGDGKKVYELPDALPLVHAIKAEQHLPLPLNAVSWKTNSLEFQLESAYTPAEGEKLFLGLTCFPGWKLYVNGAEREIGHQCSKDSAFMSADLKPGDKTFKLEFQPRRVFRYWLFPGIFLVLMAAVAMNIRREIPTSFTL